ncbi:MAG: glycosyltransferase family 4 protein [Campylobacterota bacterium]|nr:glycosyltransferase family 4 protein [Campylobacterota bacterium]
MSIKIVQFLPELNEGGVERGVVELNRELILKGYDSVVISDGGKLVSQIELDGGVHIAFDVCSKNIFTFISRVLALKKVLEQMQPDVLHVRSRVPAWIVYFANKSLGIPVVSTVHGFNSVGFYSKIMTKCDEVICVSGAIKEYVQKHYAVDEKKLSIIPRGIDLEVFHQQSFDEQFQNEFRKKFDLFDKFIISNVGRITQLKDYETFIASISKVKETMPNVVGLIVGGIREDKNDYFNGLEHMVKMLKLEKNIIFTRSQKNIENIYMLSDVVVSSSRKPESFGRAVAEAIALGTPVVATNHGGVKDIIEEEVTGYFFQMGDVNELAQNILKASTLKFDGYAKIEPRFSLDQMVDKTINVYKKVLGKNR